MAVTGYIPRVRLTLEGGSSPQDVMEGSEASVFLEVLDQNGAAVTGADVTSVSWSLYDNETAAYINSRSATKSSQTVTQAGNLSPDDHLDINSLAYTAKATPTLPRQFAIGGTADATMTNLRNAINLYDPLTTASYATPTLTVEAKTPGTNGDSISLTKVASNLTLGGANLAGGSNGVAATGSVASQRIPLLALDNVVQGAISQGERELHTFRAIVKFTSGINDLDGSAIDTVIAEFAYYVREPLVPAAP